MEGGSVDLSKSRYPVKKMDDLLIILKGTRKHLMTGVSYMIPFVVAGGILLALAVMLSGKGAVPDTKFLKDLFDIGVVGFTLMVPILAAYVAFSIADRPALAPAAIGAMVGNNLGAGFLGAIIAGLIAGIVVFYMKKIPVPKVFRSVMPIVVIPVIGTFIVAGLMMWVIGAPISAMTSWLTEWLKGFQSGSIVILATIMGLMIAFDMGGPVNKVAYAFVVLCVGEGLYNIAGISSVAVAVPPIGMGIAALIGGSKLYGPSEKEAGKAAILMGCVGITEGAIPFAAADPLRVIPSIMIGTAIGGVTAAILGVKSYAAWAGLIVLPVVDGRFGFLIALAVGGVSTALIVNLLKTVTARKEPDLALEDDLSLDIQIG